MLSQNTAMKILQILLFASVDYFKLFPYIYPSGPSYIWISVIMSPVLTSCLSLLIIDLQYERFSSDCLGSLGCLCGEGHAEERKDSPDKPFGRSVYEVWRNLFSQGMATSSARNCF